jgi:hypothetical protein
MPKQVIEAASLTTFEVAPDGTRVRMNVEDRNGDAAAVVLPLDALNQLVMTLPVMAQHALRRRTGDESSRLVFPMGEWRLEGTDVHGPLILTLSTTDGFSVSFSLERDEADRMSGTLRCGSSASVEHRPRIARH